MLEVIEVRCSECAWVGKALGPFVEHMAQAHGDTTPYGQWIECEAVIEASKQSAEGGKET